MQAEIICVGTELLLGDIVNTNAQYISKELAALGIAVYQETVVGDNPARLTRVVNDARERSDLLIFTGGLGPTDDDLTKETVAKAFHETLVEDAEELSRLEAYFAPRGGMPANNRKQALVPSRGSKLPNSCGTAPGIIMEDEGKTAILLPGPPWEMQAMFEQSVRPYLVRAHGGCIVSTMLHEYGMGESSLELQVKDLLAGANPTAALYAKDNEVAVRVTAFGPTTEQASRLRDGLVEQFRQRLGELLYSEEEEGSLEKTVVELLTQKHQRVAAAESCTGGLLCQRITSVPGASQVFDYGAVTYAASAKRRMLGVKPAALKKYTAVSSTVAAQMAFGVRRAGKANWGIGITGYAGPTADEAAGKPAGTVYVALAAEKQVWVRRLQVLRPDRQRVRRQATQLALDLLRRQLLGLSMPECRLFGRHEIEEF